MNNDTKNPIKQFVKDKTVEYDNAWIRGLIQLIPEIGSTLDTWLFQLAKEEKQKRVKEELEKLQEEVNEIKTDIHYINENIQEYSYLFERIILLIANDYRKKMRGAYRTMFTKFMSEEFSRLDNKELYIQHLSRMSPMHLMVLSEYKKILNKKENIKIEPEETKDKITNKLTNKGLDRSLADSLINDLVTKGMISHHQSSVIGGDVHHYSITSLGKKMLDLTQETEVTK